MARAQSLKLRGADRKNISLRINGNRASFITIENRNGTLYGYFYWQNSIRPGVSNYGGTLEIGPLSMQGAIGRDRTHVGIYHHQELSLHRFTTARIRQTRIQEFSFSPTYQNHLMGTYTSDGVLATVDNVAQAWLMPAHVGFSVRYIHFRQNRRHGAQISVGVGPAFRWEGGKQWGSHRPWVWVMRGVIRL